MKKKGSNLLQSDSELQEPCQGDQLMNSSKVKRSAGLSRRGFISRAVSMVVAVDFACSQKLLSSNSAGSYSVDDADDILTIIDTHTHFYDPTRAIPVGRDRPVPFPSPNDSRLYKSTLPPDWEALAKPLGMKGTVVVEAGTNWLEDNDWILKLAEQHRSIVGLIGNLSGTAIEKGIAVPVWDDMNRFKKEVRRLARNPIFRGIRVGVPSISKDLSGDRYPHFEVLADAGLVIDVGGTATDIVALAKAVPSLKIVVDHMHGFNPKASSTEKWRSDITAMGGAQNVVMKVSGSGLAECSNAPETDPASTLVKCHGALDHVYRSFGPDRLVFGTDWPVSQAKVEMSALTGFVRRYFESKGKKVLAKAFAGNAKKVYQYIDR